MRKPEKLIIYNLFPLLAGKFTAWEPHMERAAAMGFNWLFVNPVQRPGRSGSIYSLADYHDFNPLLIDEKSAKDAASQLRGVLGRGAAIGLRAKTDLVINHCAEDSPLLASHPDWFAWDAPGRVAHPFVEENGTRTVWIDVARFDHRHAKDREGMHRFFLSVVRFLIDLGFQAFRCDAAYQVPGEIWERLIRETRREYPDVIFVAETLGCTPDQTKRTARAGFDYIFNSSKWWDFNSHWLMQQYNLTASTIPSIGFPESHDTARLCEECQGNTAGLRQRYLFASLFSSGVMMPIGYEHGFRRRLQVATTRPEDWEETGVDLRSFIAAVNRIKAAHPLLQEDGPTEILQNANPNILLLWKASSTTREELLLILNKDIEKKQYFQTESLYRLVETGGAPLTDVSPEYGLPYLPTPFSYDLRPGQGIVLLASRPPNPAG